MRGRSRGRGPDPGRARPRSGRRTAGSSRSGRALDNANTGADQTPVIQWSANGGTPQQWNMTKIG
ncbi:RICIN domain-containing protein [Streptomyces sp. NPDC059697]|uniref:RICIN domain-containing protein n=1 Tax=Streptomyces sp. NPDC059697 TaxID=3346912 RepID=UPI00368915CF